MEVGNINGKMVACITASINTIRSMGLVHIRGLMGANIRGNGSTVNGMEEGRSFL
jgi:hypothetical protein